MRELIKGLQAAGKTILLASHNQGDIDALCDTVCAVSYTHLKSCSMDIDI